MPMQIGAFPGFHELNRRTNRAPVNPLDRSTIVSIYPKKIEVKKITLLPGYWMIPPGSKENPAVVTVGPSSWFKEVSYEEPLLEIPTSSVVIAESIIKDYINGIFGCDMVESQIGVFFVPGQKSLSQIKVEFPNLLADAARQQENYYNVLIKFADSLWAETSGNPMVINDEMRLAARSLGVQDRDWLKDHLRQGLKPCFACGTYKNPAYAVCPSCRAIDQSHPAAKDIKFAV